MAEPQLPARATLGDLFRLGAHMGAGLLRRNRGAGTGETACRWARELAARESAAAVRLPVPGRHIEVVTERAASDRILACVPDAGVHGTGTIKRDGMAFLAPRALTIADGAAWQRLRAFNEDVLATGRSHPFGQPFLDAVRAAFDGPIGDVEDIRAAMAVAMTRIVVGTGPDDARIADDVHALFGAVQSPLRRRLFGWRFRSRRLRFFAALEARLAGTDATEPTPTLLARAGSLAQQGGDSIGDRAELLDQVPHWMFTFTGSGTDLLSRTLTIVTSRPDVRDRVLDEIAGVGGAADAGNIEQLVFLRACLLETGRLYPPVTRTFHSAPGGRQLVHFFPLLQRDDALGADVHVFRPERWLGAEPDAVAAASNLFLRGPRACPGRDLILFVCAAAIARLAGELGVEARSARLGRDPVPFTFPEREARFMVSRVRVSHAKART
jgi:cytochrome P450